MEILIGLTLALGASLGATVAGLDRRRAFYTAVALAHCCAAFRHRASGR